MNSCQPVISKRVSWYLMDNPENAYPLRPTSNAKKKTGKLGLFIFRQSRRITNKNHKRVLSFPSQNFCVCLCVCERQIQKHVIFGSINSIRLQCRFSNQLHFFILSILIFDSYQFYFFIGFVLPGRHRQVQVGIDFDHMCTLGIDKPIRQIKYPEKILSFPGYDCV